MNREENAINLACVAEMKVKEDFDVFCIDEEQNRIMVASNEKISVFILSPFFEVQTTMIPNLETGSLHSLCLKQDRFAAVSGQEVICFSLSGQKLFQCQIPNAETIRCLTFNPLNNVYVYSTYEECSYKENVCCIKCGNYIKKPDEYDYYIYCGYSLDSYCVRCSSYGCVKKDRREMYQIISDGSNVRLFISDCLNASFLLFNEYSEHLVLSDGTTCNEYKQKI